MAKAAGVLISYDPNYRPSLWKSKEYAVKKMKSVVELVDVMKVSDEESILLTGAKSYEQAAEEILAMGPKLVAITLGEQGVLMATKSRKEIIKAFQTHAVDTTGAGDSFWGGVLCSILSINKPSRKMEWEESEVCVWEMQLQDCVCKSEVEYLRFRRKRQCLNLCRNNECMLQYWFQQQFVMCCHTL